MQHSQNTTAFALTVANNAFQQDSSLAKYWLEDYWAQNGDPRVGHLPFMGSFGPASAILLLYASFVLLIGPRWMSTRRPFSLKRPMIVYNLAMSLFNAYIVWRVIALHNFGLDAFNTRFPPLDDRSPSSQAIIHLHYIYTLSKFVDLLDTIFFVLRKKQSQVTALHFYHHFSVPIQAWTYFRLCGTDAVVIPFGLFNSVVHSVMYAYYGLTAIGPHMQPYLWWKRYITQLQIVQFASLITFTLYFLLYQEGYPTYFPANLLVQYALFIVLFTRFYMQTYKSNNDKLQGKKLD